MMIPNPIRLTKMVRKMMRSGRVTRFQHSIHINGYDSSPRALRRSGGSRRADRPGTRARRRAAWRNHAAADSRHTRNRGRRASLLRRRGYPDQGGNAIDAGVASVFAAAVCEISHFGFGGEAPTMIYDP